MYAYRLVDTTKKFNMFIGCSTYASIYVCMYVWTITVATTLRKSGNVCRVCTHVCMYVCMVWCHRVAQCSVRWVRAPAPRWKRPRTASATPSPPLWRYPHPSSPAEYFTDTYIAWSIRNEVSVWEAGYEINVLQYPHLQQANRRDWNVCVLVSYHALRSWKNWKRI